MAEGVKVLDHGFVRLVEAWGSDATIVEAARQSTQKGFVGFGPRCAGCGGTDFVHAPSSSDLVYAKGLDVEDYERRVSARMQCASCCGTERASGDEKLLAFLWTNRHSTPFEFAGATFEVQAPIFVFREWHRHRVPFGYSEASARYAPLPDLSYVPTVERCLVNSRTENRQANAVKGADVLTEAVAGELLEEERRHNEAGERLYQRKLSAGFPKELARTHLGVSRYSRMQATGNLRGWIGFLSLRDAPTAQLEIRVYAEAVRKMLEEKFPRTMALVAEERTS